MENKVIHLLLLLLILFSLSPTAEGAGEVSQRLEIYEVSPYPYPGTHMEYVCVYNPTGVTIELSSYILTDFEGTLHLRGKIAPGEKIYIAENESAFLRFMGFSPQYLYASLMEDGRFSLCNSGDEVALMKGGKVMDILVYGASTYRDAGWKGKSVSVSEGHILRRVAYRDTDTAADWSNRHVIGQSDITPSSFFANIEIFPYPDEWREVLRFVYGAEHELLIEAYQLDSEVFTDTIVSKLQEGVKVTLLLEGHPVGGMSQREKGCIHRLWERGAKVKFMLNDPKRGIFDRYTYIHSKIIIRDGSEVLISTENFGEASLRGCGNRGYGIIVRNEKFAAYMKAMFLEDSREVQDIGSYRGEFQNVSCSEMQRVELRRRSFRSINLTAKVIPLIAPDFSMEGLKGFIDSQRTLWVEASYLSPEFWKVLKNKTSRVLVARGEFPHFNGYPKRISALHAKLIIGNSAVLVGSMNFDFHSAKNNREVSLIIEDEEVVEYFRRIFEYDSHDEREFIPVMEVSGDSQGIKVDFTQSIGEARMCRVYVDGNKVYEGENLTVHLSIRGTHEITGELEDGEGRIWYVSAEISVEKERVCFDFRILLLLVVFTVFFYKVWKHHG